MYAPALVGALDALSEHAPIKVDQAALLLEKLGLSQRPFSPESVIAAACDLGFDVPVQIATAKGISLVVRAANTAHVAAILQIARRKAGASGVVSAHEVAAGVSAKSKVECSTDDVIATLEASPRFRELDRGWFWATDISPGRNRIFSSPRDGRP